MTSKYSPGCIAAGATFCKTGRELEYRNYLISPDHVSQDRMDLKSNKYLLDLGPILQNDILLVSLVQCIMIVKLKEKNHLFYHLFFILWPLHYCYIYPLQSRTFSWLG